MTSAAVRPGDARIYIKAECLSSSANIRIIVYHLHVQPNSRLARNMGCGPSRPEYYDERRPQPYNEYNNGYNYGQNNGYGYQQPPMAQGWAKRRDDEHRRRRRRRAAIIGAVA